MQGRKVHSFKSKKNSHKTSRVLKRALEMKAKPLSRTCGKCKVLKTQKKWYKGDTCGSCYRSAKAEAENKRCSKCQETKASAWYKSKEESKEDEDLCSRCYQKQRTLLAEHTCIGCQITQSTSWYKVETLLDGYRCKKCYDMHFKLSVERTCVTCQTTKSPKWAKTNSGGFRCHSCNKKKLNEEFIRNQVKHRPPPRFNANNCSICLRIESIGWASVPDALYSIKKLFEKKGLKEYPSLKATNGFLTKKKQKYSRDEAVELRRADILCFCCWELCRGSAEKKVEELLQSQMKGK